MCHPKGYFIFLNRSNYFEVLIITYFFNKVLIELATVQMTTSSVVEMQDFYEVCLKAMQCFLEQQTQRLDKSYSDEENQPEDVLMIVELFKKLTIQYIFEPAGRKFSQILQIVK